MLIIYFAAKNFSAEIDLFTYNKINTGKHPYPRMNHYPMFRFNISVYS